ncbi:ATP-binding protein [Catenuloplanes atrovinosus]|uniref:DNA helicase HerA-like ATPase n=1 Tax=Catenuloplanes atrovinosus TaxID=137266 RepID=A0AAE4C9G6_9ACTN|nr:ATP-binding protein [Catenuloplanes atrovinosus]MDR7273570.1 DNA helicase HerA-like ATPase [Catenuloplanes atrovinosus]
MPVDPSDPGPAVGRVLGTADATPLQFWTAVTPGAYLQLDDVVVTRRELPDREPVTIAGVVTQVRARHEGAQFDSDVFAIAEGTLPALVQEAAEITTTRVDPELYVPPAPGAPVHRAEGVARAQALHFDRMERPIPMGTGRDGVPVYLNADFLDGTRGAHVSISGISGVATKTSFATFLLYSVFRSGVLGAESVNSKALIFNVKGEDLLFLDHPNTRLDERTTEAYGKLGLPADAFADVRVYAPPRIGDASGTPDVSSRLTGVDAFYWTLAEFCETGLLPYVFADADDERQQYTMVVHAVTAHLARVAVPAEGGVSIQGKRIGSYGDLVDFLVEQLSDEDTRRDWAGSAVGIGTTNAFARRLISSKKDLSRLIRGDLAQRRPHSINTSESAQVTVVDLHNLPDRAQRFVVGVTLKSEFERKEKAGTAKPLLFVVLDELNKYAPRDGTSPIKEVLLDIAERGRSLGVILIGAQQTASEVERRIVTNSAVRVVGRLDPAEAGRPEYGFLPPAQRQRVLLAKPGTMFVNQPDIPVPLCVEFPFPAWATRVSEAGDAPTGTLRSIVQAADPFAVVGGRGRPGSRISDDDIPF